MVGAADGVVEGACVGLELGAIGAALGAEVTGSQMPVTTFNAVLPVSQSADSTGHFVVASSPAAKQQHTRGELEYVPVHVAPFPVLYVHLPKYVLGTSELDHPECPTASQSTNVCPVATSALNTWVAVNSVST